MNLLIRLPGGAVPNEPSTSGIFTKDLQKKSVYHVLDDLINIQWRTNFLLKPEGNKISFRGFRGKYRITWTDTEGNT